MILLRYLQIFSTFQHLCDVNHSAHTLTLYGALNITSNIVVIITM